jgi:glutamate carboxypeptidase
MLITHMGTVYQRGILATEPYKIDGNLIYGPGTAQPTTRAASPWCCMR